MQTAAQRVVGWRGHWTVHTEVSSHTFERKRVALSFAASMNKIDRTVAKRRAARRLALGLDPLTGQPLTSTTTSPTKEN